MIQTNLKETENRTNNQTTVITNTVYTTSMDIASNLSQHLFVMDINK